jgi:hypothetical protein
MESVTVLFWETTLALWSDSLFIKKRLAGWILLFCSQLFASDSSHASQLTEKGGAGL